jgi:hypothetical protein
MGPIATAFGVACWIVLGITMAGALLRSQGLQVFGVAAFVFVMFWGSMAASAQMEPPFSMAHYPAQDAALIALIWWTWGPRIHAWRIAVAGLLLVQLGFHATYWGLYAVGNHDINTLRAYILCNNVAFAGILLALAFRGAGHVLAGLDDLFDGADLTWGRDMVRAQGLPG